MLSRYVTCDSGRYRERASIEGRARGVIRNAMATHFFIPLLCPAMSCHEGLSFVHSWRSERLGVGIDTESVVFRSWKNQTLILHEQIVFKMYFCES